MLSVCFTAAPVSVGILCGEAAYPHCLFKSFAALKFFLVELRPLHQEKKCSLEGLPA